VKSQRAGKSRGKERRKHFSAPRGAEVSAGCLSGCLNLSKTAPVYLVVSRALGPRPISNRAKAWTVPYRMVGRRRRQRRQSSGPFQWNNPANKSRLRVAPPLVTQFLPSTSRHWQAKDLAGSREPKGFDVLTATSGPNIVCHARFIVIRNSALVRTLLNCVRSSSTASTTFISEITRRRR